ncbi:MULTISPECIES: MHYT domain-containing protein [Geobacillus]|nr:MULTISPECIES: MHYT domain-containing protein [Geobacillus]QIZ67767.1 response regulator [Geobacillus subterraneus]
MGITGYHDPYFIVISAVIAVVSSYVSLAISAKVAESDKGKAAWVFLGSIIIGLGIWSMHFTAMLGYRLPFPVSYRATPAVLSFLLAVCWSFHALYIVSYHRKKGWHFALSGSFMGTAISLLHYVGMVAIKTEMVMHHHPFFVCLSIVLSFFASFLALFILFMVYRTNSGQVFKKTISSIVVGCGIAAMHYTAMKGMSFRLPHGQEARPIEQTIAIPTDGLADILAFITLAILIMTSTMIHIERREVLRQKRLTEVHYQCLVDRNPHLVLSVDFNGRITSINPKAIEMLQVRQGDLPDNVYDLFFRKDHQKIEECLAKAKKGESSVLSVPIKTDRDNPVMMELTLIPIIGDKDVIGLFMIGKDVTELVEYQERIKKVQQDLWNTICQQQGLIFKFTKRDGRFVHTLCGGELFHHLGIDPKHVLDKTVHDFLPKPIADKKERYYQYAWETGEALYYEGNINGIDYLVSLRPIKENGQVTEIIGSAIDITERKMMEKALWQAKEEAEKANEAKSHFISRLSHEIRTPLNGVLGFAQLLEMDDSLNTEQRELVREILGSARHLLRLMNDMLDLAKMEAGKSHLLYDVVHPNEVIEESVKWMEPLAKKNNISLIYKAFSSEHVYLYTDATRLRQALLNLLDNAIKYNRDGGTVVVEGTEEQGKVTIRVKDSGIGIPDEEKENIFEPFYRIRGNQVDGNGIGLAFVKQVVRLLGGTIAVNSKLGKGSEFSISLPAIRYVHNGPHSPLNKRVNQERLMQIGHKKILYIEDHASNLKLLEYILQPFPNLSLTFANSGGEGLQKAADGQFDLILIDIHLPDFSGYTVLDMLRHNERTSHIPIIAISANAVPKEIKKALQAGFTDYITKPLDVSAFLEKLVGLWEESLAYKESDVSTHNKNNEGEICREKSKKERNMSF